MKVLVTGATGFVGTHVVKSLLAHGHSVVAVGRDATKGQSKPWADAVTLLPCDLHEDFRPVLDPQLEVEALIHLAWPGLPNYRGFFHLEANLAADLKFLSAAVDAGIPHLTVAGTCLEYGMQNGPLREDQVTAPTTPYGLAKDTLRKSLEMLQLSKPFTLQWVRLFYMYGEGQNPGSLLAQLDRAIDEGHPEFNMSAGEQLRDFMPVTEIGEIFATLMSNPQCNGIINCCSGVPISVRQLVENHCEKRLSNIRLNRGFYPYPTWEPMAFWGVPSKLSALKAD